MARRTGRGELVWRVRPHLAHQMGAAPAAASPTPAAKPGATTFAQIIARLHGHEIDHPTRSCSLPSLPDRPDVRGRRLSRSALSSVVVLAIAIWRRHPRRRLRTAVDFTDLDLASVDSGPCGSSCSAITHRRTCTSPIAALQRRSAAIAFAAALLRADGRQRSRNALRNASAAQRYDLVEPAAAEQAGENGRRLLPRWRWRLLR